MIFIGSESRGYFAEEFATKKGLTFAYVEQSGHISDQVNDILEHGTQDFMIFDAEQYIDTASDLASEIKRICVTNNAKPILFAPGYMSDSELIVEMRFAGINLFITAVVPSEINDQLEKCMNGYVEANGVEQLDTYIKDNAASIPLPQQRGNIIKTIAVAGVCHRIGTTTYAIQFAKLLNLLGKKACYIQMNQTQYVEQLTSWSDLEQDKRIGKVTFEGVDHFYDMEKLGEVLYENYEYYIFDFGTYNDASFNRLSFLEKDLKYIVMGVESEEITCASPFLSSEFYSDIHYIVNFCENTPETMSQIANLMDEKMPSTHVPSLFIPDKYALSGTGKDIYQNILPIDLPEDDTTPHPSRFQNFKLWKKGETQHATHQPFPGKRNRR